MSRWKLYLKRLHIGPYEAAAIIIIACIVAFRIILAAYGWPRSDSDEGTFGIEAMHIAFRGEHPIFMYGQNYMGVIESYLGAVFFHIFGVSLLSLRLGLVLMFTLFLVAIYYLASLLYDKRVAIVSLILIGLGNDIMIQRQLKAVGGGVETLLFGTLSLLLASWLALTASQEQRKHQGWRRPLAYGCWGLVVGLGLWSHLLVAPFLLASGLILLVFCWHEWRTWAIPCILIGLIIGGFPLIYYNLTVPLSQNSLSVALSITGGHNANDGIVTGHIRLLQHFSGTFLYALPIMTGYSQVCALNALPFYGGHGGTGTLLCSLAQGGWSTFYMVLLLISTAMAVLPLWQLIQEYRSHQEAWSEEQRKAAVIHFARLMLIFAGALTIFFFLVSPLTAMKPWTTRYLIGLLAITPAVIWPLVHGIRRRSERNRSAFLTAIFRYALLALMGAVFLGGTVLMLQEVPPTYADYLNDHALIQNLEQRGIDRFYSEYWTCYRLVFYSDEHLVCSVVGTNLKLAALNRIPSYEPIVASDPKAAYVFPQGPFSEAADHNPLIIKHYHRIILDSFVVYVPD